MHRTCKPQAAPRPPVSHAERKRRKAFLEAYVKEIGGYWCPGWQRPGHWATPRGGRNPLSADHVLSVAATGDESGPLQPLCRKCNSSKREKSGAVFVSHAAPAREPSPSRMWMSVDPSPSGTC